MSNPTTPAALRRKVARLEAQLAALRAFIDRDRRADVATALHAADLAARIDQATQILQGEDA